MFNLTYQERQVVVFLLTMALIGSGINFLTKKYLYIETFIRISQNVGSLDINKADKELFIEIPGIGKKLAQRIIDYRQEHGNFKDISELKNIKGITAYRYERIKDFFYLK